MSILPANLDYTSRDFDSLRARLIALVKSVFPDWSDFEVASFGTLLLEMYCFVGDVLGYRIDAEARESRLITAIERKNVIALARMLGYRLSGAQAAQDVIELRLDAVPQADVRIPAGTIVRTEEVVEPVRFQLLDEALILAGTDPPIATARAEASRSHEQLTDVQGLPNLDLPLERTPYLDGSASVSAANGEYVEIPTLLGSGPNDRHFVVLVDQNDRAILRFGNGASGAIPTGTIRVRYKTGGGAAGNVDAGRLVVLEGNFVDAAGRAVRVSATNPRRAEGGLERESVAVAQQRAPESLRATNRSVAREDFEIHARQVPGVGRALMLTSNEDASITENSGILFVVPTGGGIPTEELKQAVLRQVTETFPCTLTFQVAVQDPVYKRVDVAARVFLKQGAVRRDVAARSLRALEDFFRVTNPNGTPNEAIDFGLLIRDQEGEPAAEIAFSDVFNALRDTTGVRKLLEFQLNGASADVALRIREFPVLGSVVLLEGETGAPL